jgi:hypothetical protein
LTILEIKGLLTMVLGPRIRGIIDTFSTLARLLITQEYHFANQSSSEITPIKKDSIIRLK